MAACWRPHASDTIRAVPRTIAPAEIKPDLTFNALSLVDGSERIGRRDPAIYAAAWLDRPLQRLAVDPDQSEVGGVAPRPLEVVRVGPVEVAAHVDAVADREQHIGERLGDETAPPLVIVGSKPVLGDIDRLPKRAQLVEHHPHPGRVCAESHIGDRAAGNIEAPDELLTRPSSVERAYLAPVVSDADVVRSRLHDPPQHSWRYGPAIERQLRRLRSPTVARFRGGREKEQLVMRQADHPPLLANQLGLVKWCSVTIGWMPCSRSSPSTSR